jgi:hypothetical protein
MRTRGDAPLYTGSPENRYHSVKKQLVSLDPDSLKAPDL